MGTSAEGLSVFLAAICDIGREYGLALNVAKTKVLSVRADIVVSGPDGQALETKTSMTYLGGLLHSDGRSSHELSRRLGKAAAEFHTLQRVWARSSLSLHRKLAIVVACVLSTLTMACGRHGSTRPLGAGSMVFRPDVSGNCKASSTRTTAGCPIQRYYGELGRKH